MPNPDTMKLINDHKTLREGVLTTTLNWSSIESNMAILLETIIGKSNQALGFAIYFAPGNAETRFDIVDRALRAFIQGVSVEASIIKEWKHLKSKLDKARLKRNKIIHGNISTVFVRGKNYARLTPVIFDFQRLAKQSRGRQVPGMSAHDVSAHANHIIELQDRVALIYQAIEALRGSDEATLQQKLLELESHRQS